jgi:peptidoglycan/xylan/chitin deacetylase (PgdA/CDA1 family)
MCSDERGAVADVLRRTVATVADGPVGKVAALALHRTLPRRRGALAILTYHRVDEPEARPDLMPSLVSATPASFAEQMRMVARDFDAVALADVVAALDRPERLPRRAVLVTFDDGYRDFLTHAWPVLRAAGVPATLFVATAFASAPATSFWWDRLWSAIRGAADGAVVTTPLGALTAGPQTARRTTATIRDWLKTLDHDDAMREVDRIVGDLRGGRAHAGGPAVLGWDELRSLAGEGVTLAPHTRHHPLLDRVPLERAVDEIQGSYADLTKEIGGVAEIPKVLAYPSGSHGGSAVDAARLAGMTAAVTTERGGNDLRRADRLRLRRINVGGRAGVPLIRAQLAWAAAIDARRGAGS